MSTPTRSLSWRETLGNYLPSWPRRSQSAPLDRRPYEDEGEQSDDDFHDSFDDETHANQSPNMNTRHVQNYDHIDDGDMGNDLHQVSSENSPMSDGMSTHEHVGLTYNVYDRVAEQPRLHDTPESYAPITYPDTPTMNTDNYGLAQSRYDDICM